MLDATGNLKAVQKLLGHASIQTTGDIYTDLDVEQLAQSLLDAVPDQEPEMAVRKSFPTGLQEIPANGVFMEAAGIEPASADAPTERLQA